MFDTNRVIAIGSPPLPGNSQITYMIDTTWIGNQTQTLATSAQTVLGPHRYVMLGRRYIGQILCTGQNVTATFEILDPDGAWATDVDGPGTAGVQTVTATVIYKFSWLPNANEHRIKLTAGGTGPTTLTTTLFAINDRNPGA